MSTVAQGDQPGREPRVTMRQLADQLAKLTEQVQQLALREVFADALYDRGFMAGQEEARKLTGRPGRARRPRREASHLHTVQAQ